MEHSSRTREIEKTHFVPLTQQALNLLNVMKPISAQSVYIFPSDRSLRNHTNASTANMALKRMGFGNQLVARGLRSMANTTLNENGFDPDVIEAALAHIGKNEVQKAYNLAEYIERRKPVMAWWNNYIENAATGNLV